MQRHQHLHLSACGGTVNWSRKCHEDLGAAATFPVWYDLEPAYCCHCRVWHRSPRMQSECRLMKSAMVSRCLWSLP